MKRFILTLLVLVTLSAPFLVQEQAYVFTEEVNHGRSAVKDQCRTGTCWSYSTVSFLESEVLRLTGKSIDLSEMFNVRMTYPKKAEMFIRYQGKHQFGPGSLSHDVMRAVEAYGIVPESAYPGHPVNQPKHDHGELDAVLEAMVKAVVEHRTAASGKAWEAAVQGVLDAYLGAVPEQFTFAGQKYTPASFRDMLKITASDYVSLTSFSHHPFHTEFILEVPDNFSQGRFYNLPIDELEGVVLGALTSGFTVAWDADVSERGFSFRDGMALMPGEDVKKEDLFKTYITEPNVTQESRQAGFDNFQTTDDHLMHITGLAKDQKGNRYFIVKNSWGVDNPHGGYQYVSMAYFRAKTVAVMLHKRALPLPLLKKSGY